MLSVPPLVMNPAADGGACSQPATASTTSACMVRRLGNASVLRALAPLNRAYAASASASTSGPAE